MKVDVENGEDRYHFVKFSSVFVHLIVTIKMNDSIKTTIFI